MYFVTLFILQTPKKCNVCDLKLIILLSFTGMSKFKEMNWNYIRFCVWLSRIRSLGLFSVYFKIVLDKIVDRGVGGGYTNRGTPSNG